ncbi:hypothetical protein U2W12_01995 [Methylomicrobium sp. Wu6]|nr:hypothetical protein [Methylomicrobium sp. Wu6]
MLAPVAYLEAKDASRNIHRAYSIAYGQDLFGNWIGLCCINPPSSPLYK